MYLKLVRSQNFLPVNATDSFNRCVEISRSVAVIGYPHRQLVMNVPASEGAFRTPEFRTNSHAVIQGLLRRYKRNSLITGIPTLGLTGILKAKSDRCVRSRARHGECPATC